MRQLPGLPSTQEDEEEKLKCICFLQKRVIACLWKPEQENYRCVGVGEWHPLSGAPLAAAWPLLPEKQPMYVRCGSRAGDG